MSLSSPLRFLQRQAPDAETRDPLVPLDEPHEAPGVWR